MEMISRIENAVVDALRAQAKAFRVDTIESYGGQLDDDLLDWVRRLPALWVVFAGGDKPKAMDTGLKKWLYRGTFTVFCAQRNLAGNKALRQGDALNPGVYALLQLVREVLLHRDLGLPIRHFEPGPIKTISSFVFNADAVMVYASNWNTEWVEVVADAPLDRPGELQSIGLNYFLKPGDDQADAVDVLTTN